MSKDYCDGCQDRHYNDDMVNVYLCDECETILYQGKAEIERLTDALEQYRSDLAERDKVARDRLKRIEMLEAVFQRIADSGIENNFAWAWIGGIAKQILQSAVDSDPEPWTPCPKHGKDQTEGEPCEYCEIETVPDKSGG